MNKEQFSLPESAYQYNNESEMYRNSLFMLSAITGLEETDLSPAEAAFMRNEIRNFGKNKPFPEYRYSEEVVAGLLANYYGIEDMNILHKIAGGVENIRYYVLSERKKRELL